MVDEHNGHARRPPEGLSPRFTMFHVDEENKNAIRQMEEKTNGRRDKCWGYFGQKISRGMVGSAGLEVTEKNEYLNE